MIDIVRGKKFGSYSKCSRTPLSDLKSKLSKYWDPILCLTHGYKNVNYNPFLKDLHHHLSGKTILDVTNCNTGEWVLKQGEQWGSQN